MSLDGGWDGDFDCGFGTLAIEFDLEKDGDVYVGEGVIDDFTVYGYNSEINFEVEVEKSKMFGDQDLDVNLDNCEIKIQGYGTEDVDCDDPDNFEWDGEDNIQGEIKDFLGSGYDCDVDADR